eukprot:7734762-Heterocapsa_arctica.AAC.1
MNDKGLPRYPVEEGNDESEKASGTARSSTASCGIRERLRPLTQAADNEAAALGDCAGGDPFG